MPFNGNTSDTKRNAAQVQLADSLGNASTRPRSIDIAIRLEMKVYERSRDRVSDHYNTHIAKLVGLLKDGGPGMQQQQRLLAGVARPDSWVEEVVPRAKKPKKTKSKKSSEVKEEAPKKKDSAGDYYFFRSTPKEQAKKFQPKRLTEPQPTAAPRPIAAASTTEKNISAAPSTWNKGGTWEERNLTPFTHKRIKELMAKAFVPFVAGPLNVEAKEWKIDGDATLVLVRGKKRLGYELTITAEFKGTFQDEKVEGKVTLPSVDMQESEDGDFDIQYEIKKPKLGTKNYGAIKAQLNTTATARIQAVLSQIAGEVRTKASQM